MVTTTKSKFPINLIEADFVEKRLTLDEIVEDKEPNLKIDNTIIFKGKSKIPTEVS